MATKKSVKKQSKTSRAINWFKPTSPAKGMVVFAVVFAVVGGTFFAFKSFAATPGGISASGTSSKDAYGCPTYVPSRPTLSIGSSGSCVKTLQNDLNRYFKNNGLTVDGQFGSKTKSTVIYYQASAPILSILGQLTADGVVGPNTWHSLHCNVEVQCQALLRSQRTVGYNNLR